MKLTISCLSILLIGFYSCGKKEVIKTNVKNDTLTNHPIPDSSKPNIIRTETVITNEVNVTDESVKDPNASPEAVVKTIIKAAKTGKYDPLMKLCNQTIDMDGDAKDICNVASSKGGNQKEFNDYFGNAKIVGKIRVKGNLAEVDIETTAEGGSNETIVVQQKYDKWYLKGL